MSALRLTHLALVGALLCAAAARAQNPCTPEQTCPNGDTLSDCGSCDDNGNCTCWVTVGSQTFECAACSGQDQTCATDAANACAGSGSSTPSCPTPLCGGDCCPDGDVCCTDSCEPAGSACCGSAVCVAGDQCCNENICAPPDAVCCGTNACVAGDQCCDGQCIPGDTTCCNGSSCAQGMDCLSCGCVASGTLIDCGGGNCCSQGDSCSATGCLPPGTTDCNLQSGVWYYCPQLYACGANGDCIGGVDCGNGSYCPTGQTCDPAGGCIPAGDVVCGNGYCYSGDCCGGGCISGSNGETCCGDGYCQNGLTCQTCTVNGATVYACGACGGGNSPQKGSAPTPANPATPADAGTPLPPFQQGTPPTPGTPPSAGTAPEGGGSGSGGSLLGFSCGSSSGGSGGKACTIVRLEDGGSACVELEDGGSGPEGTSDGGAKTCNGSTLTVASRGSGVLAAPVSSTSETVFDSSADDAGALTFQTAVVNVGTNATAVPPGAPAGTEVAYVVQGGSGFFEVTFTLPAGAVATLQGAANVNASGRVFLNDVPLTPALGQPGALSATGNVTFSTTTGFLTGTNTLEVSDDTQGSAGGAAFYAVVSYVTNCTSSADGPPAPRGLAAEKTLLLFGLAAFVRRGKHGRTEN